MRMREVKYQKYREEEKKGTIRGLGSDFDGLFKAQIKLMTMGQGL